VLGLAGQHRVSELLLAHPAVQRLAADLTDLGLV
jgi:hypothetical protein